MPWKKGEKRAPLKKKKQAGERKMSWDRKLGVDYYNLKKIDGFPQPRMFPEGRKCRDCGDPMNRYTVGDQCNRCWNRENLGEVPDEWSETNPQ